jgi:hypothetical protein
MSIIIPRFERQTEATTHHIENVQKLAEEVTEGVGVVCAHAVDEIANQALLAVASFGDGHRENASKTFGDHAHLALLPVLPDPVGNVEHQALELLVVSGGRRTEETFELTWKKSMNGTHW